ncbi:VOC family protein [Streptomyces triticirhizae]|uniref:VOC family protein n=1 Tax=Streptomyces triticirhizae TaxID=2483353 RepID=A0A3M2LPX1_9ACTN|nr:VOC family protein [Streptomyces triticirhizae]RMI38930.1 VOC family protein [Streptomyces triticirhizae]
MHTSDTASPLAQGSPSTRLPAQDLDRARRFYAELLGLEPADERPGGLLYRCGGVEFSVFLSAGTSPGTFTQMSWSVPDIAATVAELKRRGVEFEHVELPDSYEGERIGEEIVEVRGHYPSRNARGERGAWFRDSEGNMLSVGQDVV